MIVFSGAGSGLALASDKTPQLGDHVPQFVLNDINGKAVSLAKYSGKVILLNFWASWCHACKSEMSSMNDLYRSLNSKGLEVVAVSVDSSEDSLKSFLSGRAIAFPILFDKNGEGYFQQFHVFGLPATFLINRKGILVDKFMGSTDWDSPGVRNKILGILKQQ